ncbi:MAG: uroporphyrinogen-III synthase [Pseudomonadota bacterium]
MPEPEATLLLTRPMRESQRFAQLARSRIPALSEVVVSPIFEIEALDPVVDPDLFGTLVFTSANAVRVLSEQHDIAGRIAICVGDKTASTAGMLGMKSISANGTASDLVDLIETVRPRTPLLHVRGAQARGRVADRLNAAGLATQEAIVYRQVPKTLSAEAGAVLRSDDPVVLPVFSPRSASLLSEEIPETGGPLHVVAMSDAVAEAWVARKDTLRKAGTPDAGAMVDQLAPFFPA